jgi:hypothetical protein
MAARSAGFRSPTTLFGILIGAVIVGLILVALTFRRGTSVFEGFESVTGSSAPGLSIEYFCMSGCPFCDKFESTWKSFTELDSGGKYTTARYNLSESGGKERGEKFNVNSAPTILAIFNEEIVASMDKNRTIENLKEFAAENHKKKFPKS